MNYKLKNQKKMKIKKKYGIVFWITGISGSGKSMLSKSICSFIIKKFGPTIILSGDNLRRIFKLKKYDKESRFENGKNFSKFFKIIIKNKINVLFSVVGLFHKLHKFNRKNFKNYIEILIKADFKKAEKRKKKYFYKKGIVNVWGRDINPELPKKPHIIIKNDFKKNKNYLSEELIKKIKNLNIEFI
jgi:adenylylsulfate kinase